MLRLIEYLLIRWAELARRGRWAVIALFVIGAALAAFFAAGNLKVNTDTSEMLDPDLPFQQSAAALREAFPQIKTDLVVIVGAETLDEADAYAGALRARLLARDDQFSAVFAPAEEPFFLENGLLYLDTDELESRLAQMTKAAGLIETLIQSPTAGTLFATLAENDELADRSDLGQDTLRQIYAELADVIEGSLEGRARPFSWMDAIDPEDDEDGVHLRLVYATPVLDFARLQPARPAIAALRDEIALLGAEFDGRVDVYITGDPALRGEELESVTTGIGLSFLLSFVLVSLLLFFALRSIPLAAMTMAALLITISLTSAFATFAVGELNLVSIAFTVLLVGLGLDFAIHLLLHVQERRGKGQDMRRALRGSMHEIGAALALSTVTTTLAFLSFVPTRFDGIAQLGIIAGAGVVIAFFVSVTFMPAALGALPRRSISPTGGAVRRGFARIERVGAPVAIATIALGLASLALLPQARFDADPMSLRDPSSQSVQGFNLLFSDQDTVPYRLTYLASDAEAAARVSDEAKSLDVVDGTRSLPDFVPDDQEDKLDLIDFAAGSLAFSLAAERDPNADPREDGARELEARLAEAYSDGPGARLGALLEQVRKADDPALDARIEQNIFRFWPLLVSRMRAQFNADFVDMEGLPAPLVERYRSADGLWRVDILPAEDLRDRAALERFVEAVAERAPDISGSALQSVRAGQVISGAMLQATAIALGIIAFVLWLLVRRPAQVFLMIMPLILAAALTTATGVIANIPFNYANVIVLPLLLGIGVDSGIHLVLRHSRISAEGGVYDTATPRAVLFSALTTVASFGSLMLSSHRGTASMGELLSIAIAYTLVCTLIVLPAAFGFGERLNGRRAARAAESASPPPRR